MSVKPMFGHVPWTGAPAQEVQELANYFCDQMGEQLSRYLPNSIALFADLEVSSNTIETFLVEMAERLTSEIRRRNQRVQKFSELGLLTQDDIESFLTDHTDSQPWALYYGQNGGLGAEKSDRKHWQAPRGVLPCSTMPNHGVAWWHTNDDLNVWLNYPLEKKTVTGIGIQTSVMNQPTQLLHRYRFIYRQQILQTPCFTSSL
jgi:hypothetical protein